MNIDCSDQHVATIWEINRDRLAAMHHKLSDTPKLLSVDAGRTTCSIFKVPKTPANVKGESYKPNIVFVGPLHHGEPHLEMIEEHKWRLLKQMLNRARAIGMVLEDLLRVVQPLECMARECYSRTIPYENLLR